MDVVSRPSFRDTTVSLGGKICIAVPPYPLPKSHEGAPSAQGRTEGALGEMLGMVLWMLGFVHGSPNGTSQPLSRLIPFVTGGNWLVAVCTGAAG